MGASLMGRSGRLGLVYINLI